MIHIDLMISIIIDLMIHIFHMFPQFMASLGRQNPNQISWALPTCPSGATEQQFDALLNA